MGNILFALCVLGGVAALGAAITSYQERERRAALIFAGLAVTFAGLASLSASLTTRFPALAASLGALGIIAILVLTIPYDPVRKTIRLSGRPSRRFDERDTMFSRRRLKPGTRRFEQYYDQHPGRRSLDQEWRRKPGLLARGSSFYDPLWFRAAEASFDVIEHMHTLVDGEPAPERVPIEPELATEFVKDWLLRSGAHSAGITRLRDYHLYTHRGRQEPYGQPIELRHTWAIALTVEMSREMIRHAPYAPTVLESADQYLRSGAMAVKLALLIRKLGYPARAHVDANYEVICPLVARDAGLGEIGRMGLLMTPRLGPRVRIAVVTTDLPLLPDSPRPDPTVIDFCNRCLKCAENCPAQAIPTGTRQSEAGALRWKINAEACFTYWCSVGTDCARCVHVCPYSHPDNWLHRTIRSGISRSLVFRRIAAKLDDVFYEAKPPPQPIPPRLRYKCPP